MRAAMNRQSTINTFVDPIATTIPKGTILIQTSNESVPEPMQPTDSVSRPRETTVQQPDQTTVKEPQISQKIPIRAARTVQNVIKYQIGLI